MMCIGKTKCTSEKGLLPLATKETFMTFNNLFHVFMGLHVFLCGSAPRADSGEVQWRSKTKKLRTIVNVMAMIKAKVLDG